MQRPFRFWMTGCVAVVMAGFVGGRTGWAGDAPLRRLASRYDVLETEQRIFRKASHRGYGVFAQVRSPATLARSDGSLIVFRTAAGVTPVLMAQAGAEPSLPLSVRVRRGMDGATEVECAATDWDLPPDVVRDVAAVRLLVADALA